MLPKGWQELTDLQLSALERNTDNGDDRDLIYEEIDKREQHHGYGDDWRDYV